jgi:hypothetical protein
MRLSKSKSDGKVFMFVGMDLHKRRDISAAAVNAGIWLDPLFHTTHVGIW